MNKELIEELKAQDFNVVAVSKTIFEMHAAFSNARSVRLRYKGRN